VGFSGTVYSKPYAIIFFKTKEALVSAEVISALTCPKVKNFREWQTEQEKLREEANKRRAEGRKRQRS
jgi:hypothetical protein